MFSVLKNNNPEGETSLPPQLEAIPKPEAVSDKTLLGKEIEMSPRPDQKDKMEEDLEAELLKSPPKEPTTSQEEQELDLKTVGEEVEKLSLKDKTKKLSGAARKRKKWLKKQGYSGAEATERALIPMDASNRPPAKRPRSAGTTPETNPEAKRSKMNDPTSGKKETSSRSYRQAITGKKMGVLPEGYPDNLLTTDQLNLIQEGIIGAILEQKEEDTKPNFHNATFRAGWLSLICGDDETAEWLKQFCATATPWEGAKLRAVEEKDLPRPRIAVGYFPNAGEDSTEKILGLVKGQNKGLDTTQWRVLNRKTLDAMTCITVSVDEPSANILENSNRVNFKFRDAKVILKRNKSLEEAKSGAAAEMEVDIPEVASVPQKDEATSSSRPPPKTSKGHGSKSLNKDVQQQKTSTAAQGGSQPLNVERRNDRQEDRAFRPPLQKKQSKASSNPHLPSRKGPRGGRQRRK